MPASLASLLSHSFRAIARRLPSSAPVLSWTVEGGVSAAQWTAPEAADTVPAICFEIRPDAAARQPFVLTVSPEGYGPVSFPVSDLETAHELARRQLAVTRRLPAVQPAGADAAPCQPAMLRPAAGTVEILPAGQDEAA